MEYKFGWLLPQQVGSSDITLVVKVSARDIFRYFLLINYVFNNEEKKLCGQFYISQYINYCLIEIL